ncbi:MAG TPA: lycopene cyclase domain-containing protein [Anaerolineales bacterium]|nr:lycopene cyclase domain-containing protein [Anaerolineales bacterium]
MTYFGFLLRFLVVPILIFLAVTYRDHKKNKQITGFRNGGAVWVAIGIHILLAVIYTTPWDNYLVATGVWYYNPDLVTRVLIGYVPIEEYTFFILETILSGLWWWFLVRQLSLTPTSPSAILRDCRCFPGIARQGRCARRSQSPGERGGFTPNKLLVYLSTCILIFLWLFFTYLFFFGETHWTYLSITLFWAFPPIFVQLLFGADILWTYRKLVVPAILFPATYLSLIDMIALKGTTWAISHLQTTGVLFFGILPLEEVLFFFLTNALITFGITLLLANVSQERFAEMKIQVRGWITSCRLQSKGAVMTSPPTRDLQHDDADC